MNPNYDAQRAQILQQMAALESMEQGSVKAEYRLNNDGSKVGPYYKHQAWKNGANSSRRVPADEAASLELAIANRQKFEELANRFIELTVAQTRLAQGQNAQKKTPLASWPKKRKSPS